MGWFKIGDLFTLQMGKTPARSNSSFWGNGHIWVSISDLSNCNKYIASSRELITDDAVQESGIRIVPQGTLIMSFKLSLGKTAITASNLYTNEAIMAFIDKKIVPLDINYVYHLFNNWDWSRATNKAVMGLTLNKATLSQIKIPIPSLNTQKAIANILDKIDESITLRKRQLEIFNQLVKSRFIEMFGHSDRPKVRLGECCIINPKKSSDIRLVDNDLMVSFVSMSDVSEDGQIVTCNHKQYESVKSGFTYFSENDVLFAKITPCMENGKGGIAKGLLNGIGFGSTEFHVLRPIDQVSNSCWLYELTSFPQFRQAAEINMTGSAGQRRVPASFLANYKVSLPPISLQNQFADFVHQLDKSKMAVQKSLDELETLKKSLMQTYFG